VGTVRSSSDAIDVVTLNTAACWPERAGIIQLIVRKFCKIL